jgi:hypothetical protein
MARAAHRKHNARACRSIAAAVVLAAFVASSAHASEWSVTPSATVSTVEDTNVYMQAVAPLRATSANVNASADVLGRNAATEFRFTPRISSIRYDDARLLDRNDIFADLGFSKHDDLQRWTVGAGYMKEGTLQSDFETNGFARVDLDRTQTSFNAGYSRVVERGSFAIAGSATRVDYQESLFSPYRDYQYDVLQGSYSRATTERSSWTFIVAGTQVTSSASTFITFGPFVFPITFPIKTSSIDVRARWSHALSGKLQLRVGFGALEASTSGLIESRRTAPGYDFRLDRVGERWSLYASAGRQLQPDSRGSLQRQDTAELGLTRRLNEKLSISTSIIEGEIQGIGTVFDRTFGQAGVALERRVQRRWYIDGGLYHRHEHWTGIPPATGTQIQLSANYHR